MFDIGYINYNIEGISACIQAIIELQGYATIVYLAYKYPFNFFHLEQK